MNIKNIIKQPEGRRLEFKEQIPPGTHLVRTVIAFSNDAGGEIFLGVKDEPREIVGLNPDKIISLEERISSMIFDQCSPVILPEFTIMTVDKKTLLRIRIFKGNNPPYFLKSKGKESGTYIRVGSSIYPAAYFAGNDRIRWRVSKRSLGISDKCPPRSGT